MPVDYLQQQIPSPSSSSPSYQHHQPESPPNDTLEHRYNQRHQHQQSHSLQQYHHLRRSSDSHHHLQHPYLYQHPLHRHQVPVVQSLKRRRRLTTEESEFLMVQFNLNGRPTAQERDSFARHLKLDRRTIQVWFQNRRAKLKRDERGGCRQNVSTGGSGGGAGGDDDDEGEDDGDFGDGTDGVQEASKERGVGREPGHQLQQTIHQQLTEEEDLFRLLSQQQPYPLLAPPTFDILDLEGEGSGGSDDLSLEVFHNWSTNDEADYNNIGNSSNGSNSNSNSNSNTSSRGEMMPGMGMGLAQTARLGMELFSGQHYQYYQLQQQQQQLQMAQVAAQEHDLPHPLQRWCLPFVDGASFRDCPP
ncbi:hypothetical protein BGZ89_004257 [Linnemannia elongata]|nr:hypothetical protein BGZ89_004257 [Linnemannia elongata]